MRIKSLEMSGFLSHTNTKLVFPERGMILISGPNGAGKSSILEAVSVGVWKTVLRGRGRMGSRSLNLWGSKKGRIRIETPDAVIERRASGKLSWARPGEEPIKFESQSKAQAALETLVGPQDSWAKRFIFSSESALFTAGTDADRTRLIESILGLDDFDGYAEKARRDLQLVMAKLDALRREELVLEERVRSARTAVTEWEAPEAPECFGEVVTAATAEDVRARYQALLADARPAADTKLRELAQRRARLGERLRAASKAEDSGVCPTCGRELEGHGAEAGHGAVADPDVLRKKLARLVRKERKATKERDRVEALRDKWLRNHDAVQRWERETAEANEERVEAAGQLEDAEDELGVLLQKRAKLELELEELKAVERVLGFGGVRSNLLSDALIGIESITNSWLRMFSSAGDYQLQVSLKPYVEKKSGGNRPAIHVGVEGVANGQGYLAASNGERRRVDAALLLSLPEVSVTGDDLGVLFFDELFDHLDDEGRDAVCEILREISKRCCVVLITHSRALRARISPMVDEEWRIEGGTVHVR